MFLCKFHTQFRKKTRERESFQSLLLNEKLYYSYFLSFIIIICVLEHFFFHYISIVILYVFFNLYFRCSCSSIFVFVHYFFFLFSIFHSFTFYLYQSILKKDERERGHLFVVSQ
jgi:hypothetical protein